MDVVPPGEVPGVLVLPEEPELPGELELPGDVELLVLLPPFPELEPGPPEEMLLELPDVPGPPVEVLDPPLGELVPELLFVYAPLASKV